MSDTTGHLLDRDNQFTCCFVIELKQVGSRLFRQDQRMPVALRHDIEYGKAMVGLVNREGGNFTAQDSGKDVVVVVSHVGAPAVMAF